MLGPYREPVLNEPDALPDTCVPDGERPQRCPRALARARSGLPAAYARALSASATALLLVASGSLAALTWTVTSTILADRHERSATPNPPRLVPQAYTRRPPRASEPPVLAELGKETHDPDALWARAEHASSRAPLTLAHARLAPGALAPAWLPGSFQLERRPGGRTGLRVLASPEGSYAALLGLQKGDLITAIDGFTFRHPEDVLSGYAELRFGRSTVIELERAGRAIVLRVDAPAPVDG